MLVLMILVWFGSLIECGVIASTCTSRHKGKYLQNRPHRIIPIKNGSIKLDILLR